MCVYVSRDMDIWMPDMEQQEVPAGWWDTAADRSLLVGVFKHGEQGGGHHILPGQVSSHVVVTSLTI